MKIVSLIRVIKFGLINYWRNIWLTLATTLLMVLTLFTISSLFVLSMLGGEALNSIKEKVDISIYLKPNASEVEMFQVRNDLLSMPEVKTVQFVSKEKALELFKDKHEDNELIISSIEELEQNPLQASLVVKARYAEDYTVISEYLKKDEYSNTIEKITFEDNEAVINKIDKTTKSIEKIGIIISLIFGIITIIFTFNTIRLTIYTQKDEIKVMKLMGAKNLFIRFPFVIESILYALIASIISSIILYLLVRYNSSHIIDFIDSQQFDVISYINSKIWYLFLFQLGLGISLSIISSFIALRKYLKV